MNFRGLQIILIIAIFFSACTPYKTVPYFQDIKRDSITRETIKNFSPLTVQPGDLLAIHVTSLSHEADQVYNYNLERPSGINGITGANTAATPSENVVYGHLVDSEGNINMPNIGKVKVSDLTMAQITATLEARLSEYMTNPIVNVRIQNFRVSVLGDVARPGVVGSSNDRLSVPEALAQVGDLTTTGIRKILLIREIDGKRITVPLDLSSKDIFNSPYYYLKNNDVIYVQPNHDKVSASDSAFQKASLIIAALSLFAIFLTR